MQTPEKIVEVYSGWLALTLLIIALPVLVFAIVAGAAEVLVPLFIGGVAGAVIWFVCCLGFYTLQPNQAAVLILFGKYVGTDKTSGFRWANPFYRKNKVSLRARNLNMEPIKVNDSRGNPIQIAAVVVWRVENTAQAVFDVDSFEEYVSVQSESALRHLAMAYPYDSFDEHERSLRGSPDEVSASLQTEIQDRVAKAGVTIEEAKLSHLAYAQEIAGVMLKRQQAEAVVAARLRIVEGAVGMVEMALQMLQEKRVIELDDERRAQMVSNLLVVLCGQADAQPVINTGTLYG
jgi:regulator of protease activity HflC (stomatin/prohibitin superfamily)